jgi:hypothetical protein
MSNKSIDWFLEGIDNTMELIRTVKSAYKSGLNINFVPTSPVDPLLDILIDLLMKASMVLREDFKAIVTPNPELTFSERMQDVLGNPLQKRISPKPLIVGPDFFSSYLLRQIAEYLILLKKEFQISFDRKFWEPSAFSGRLHALRILRKNFLRRLADLERRVAKKRASKHSMFHRMQGKTK